MRALTATALVLVGCNTSLKPQAEAPRLLDRRAFERAFEAVADEHPALRGSEWSLVTHKLYDGDVVELRLLNRPFAELPDRAQGGSPTGAPSALAPLALAQLLAGSLENAAAFGRTSVTYYAEANALFRGGPAPRALFHAGYPTDSLRALP
ncbi:hypothetical protein [Rubrivirga sp.]|uniref:hypothetical protein n=1 Tax=Rubrivirga sp. TaxID=1885344 RepID=UPI003B52ADFC